MLIIAATWAALVFDPALVMKLMHVVESATKATGRHYNLNHVWVSASDLFKA